MREPMTAEKFLAIKRAEKMRKVNRELTDFTKEYLTVEEIAKNLKVSKMTVLRHIYDGKIEAYRFGRSWRIPAKSKGSGKVVI